VTGLVLKNFLGKNIKIVFNDGISVKIKEGKLLGSDENYIYIEGEAINNSNVIRWEVVK
jgi:hypothetical protein